jgi:hypothetical protein
MSLSLGQAWIQKAISKRTPQGEALRALDQASAHGSEATLIVGSRLTTSGRCYLARWDGWELTVLELNQTQQKEWNVNPLGLYQELRPISLPVQRPTADPLVSISDVCLSTETYNGWTPMTGTCWYDFDASPGSIITNAALRVRYFRPNMPRSVTAMWYVDAGILPPDGELQFTFPQLFSENSPQLDGGTLVLFLQLLDADDWVKAKGSRTISNVTAAFVSLQ